MLQLLAKLELKLWMATDSLAQRRNFLPAELRTLRFQTPKLLHIFIDIPEP
jgi:hypothetical protein